MATISQRLGEVECNPAKVDLWNFKYILKSSHYLQALSLLPQKSQEIGLKHGHNFENVNPFVCLVNPSVQDAENQLVVLSSLATCFPQVRGLT